MLGNRKAAEARILADIEKILPGSENPKYYQALFEGMDDQQFDAFMRALESGELTLSIIAPNFDEHQLDVKRNFATARQWGHAPFERVWMNDGDGTPMYLSNDPYPIMEVPVRRQAQLQDKKISVAEDAKSVDDLTGQPTGRSKGSKISFPELQLLAAQGLDDSIIELIKFRGGDTKGYNAFVDSLSGSGGVSLKAIQGMAGGVTSTQTLRTLLLCMHVTSTIPAAKG
jgi:hypothetical protein